MIKMRGYERSSYIFNRLHHENEEDTIFLGYGLEYASTDQHILKVMNEKLTYIKNGMYQFSIDISCIKTILWVHNITQDDIFCIDDKFYYDGEDKSDIMLCVILKNDDIIGIR